MIFELHGENLSGNSAASKARLRRARLSDKKGSTVLFGNKNKPRERFYLLPGQGGRNYYRKQRRIMGWTVAVSLLFGLVVALLMWRLARPGSF